MIFECGNYKCLGYITLSTTELNYACNLSDLRSICLLDFRALSRNKTPSSRAGNKFSNGGPMGGVLALDVQC